jgi:hypothetical protein
MNTSEYPVMMWLLMAAAFFIIVALFIIENKQLKKELSKTIDADSLRQIINFSWSRTIQFFCVVALLFFIICFYDYKVKSLHFQIESMVQMQKIDSIAPPEVKIVQLQAEEPAAVNLIPYIPEGSIQDVFTGSDDSDAIASKSNLIKSRYEELLVNYLLMDKCKKTEINDYDIITSALDKDIAEANAPQHLAADILDAAKGSFDELYSDIYCGDPFIENSSEQYRRFIASLSKKITP